MNLRISQNALPTLLYSIVALACFSMMERGIAQTTNTNAHDEIKRYLNPNIFVVGWANLQETNIPKLRSFVSKHQILGLESYLGTPGKDGLDRAEAIRSTLLKLGVERLYWISDLAMLNGPRATVMPCDNPQAVAVFLETLFAGEKFHVEIDRNVVLAGSKDAVEVLKASAGEVPQDLWKAINEAHGSSLIVSSIPSLSGLLMQALQTSMKDDLETLGRAAQVIVKTRTITVSTPELPPSQMTLSVAMKDNESARQIAELANRLSSKHLPEAQAMIRTAVSDDQPVATFSTDSSDALLQTMASKLGVARTRSMNSLKQIALALHNFYSAMNHLPPQSLANKSGQRLLSWRVLILPFLDEAQLYQQFNLDEPWDSPTNLKAAASIPAPYAMHGDQATSPEGVPMTRMLSPITKESVFGRPGEPVNFPDILDGTSNTVWIVEANSSAAVPWSKPNDLVIDKSDPLAQIVAPGTEGFVASMVDGSVHFFQASIKPEIMNALITIAGKEIIPFDEL